MTLLIGFLTYWYVKGSGGPDPTSYLVLGAWLVAVMLLCYVAEWVWVKWVGPGKLLWILYPGSLLHRLCHAAVALVLGCTLTRLSLYTPGRDDVDYSAPPARWLGAFVVAFVPVLVALSAIRVAGVHSGEPIDTAHVFPMTVEPTQDGAQDYAERAWGQTKLAWGRVWDRTDFRGWHTWLFIYLLITFTATLTPTRRELPIVIGGVVLTALVLFALERWEISALLKHKKWVGVLEALWHTLVLAVLAAEISCAASLAAAGACRIARGRRGKA